VLLPKLETRVAVAHALVFQQLML